MCLSWVCLAFGTAADDLTAVGGWGGQLIVPASFLASKSRPLAVFASRPSGLSGTDPYEMSTLKPLKPARRSSPVSLQIAAKMCQYNEKKK